jgi:hypothetical protein
MTPIASLRNLGPAMEAAFARAGIASAEALHGLGADDAYARLMESGHRPHFMAYLALVAGLQGRPWTDVAAPEKAALRARFDHLCASRRAAPDDALDRALDALGVRPPAAPRRPAG